jgi:hypothetical protein
MRKIDLQNANNTLPVGVYIKRENTQQFLLKMLLEMLPICVFFCVEQGKPYTKYCIYLKVLSNEN